MTEQTVKVGGKRFDCNMSFLKEKLAQWKVSYDTSIDYNVYVTINQTKKGTEVTIKYSEGFNALQTLIVKYYAADDFEGVVSKWIL